MFLLSAVPDAIHDGEVGTESFYFHETANHQYPSRNAFADIETPVFNRMMRTRGYERVSPPETFSSTVDDAVMTNR